MYSGDFVHALAYINEQDESTRSGRRPTRSWRTPRKTSGSIRTRSATSWAIARGRQGHCKVQQAFASMDLTPMRPSRDYCTPESGDRALRHGKETRDRSRDRDRKLYSEHVTGIIAFDQAIEEMEKAMTGSDAGLNSMIQRLLADRHDVVVSVGVDLYRQCCARGLHQSLPARIAGKAGRPEDPGLQAPEPYRSIRSSRP